MKKRALAWLLVLCLICSLFSVAALAAGAEDFSDVVGDAWYYDYVDYVTTEGYFLGVGDGKFAPEETMTRAMFVTVLSRLAGAETDDTAEPFDDVAAGEWYTGAVAWAAEQGIANGVGDNKFAPNDPVTRQDMCVFMDRFVTWYETANSVTHEEEAMVEAFGDANTIGSWATEAVENCRQYGLVNGYEDGNFHPLINSTRAQVAAVIYRLSWLTNKSNSSGGGGSGGSNGKTDTDTDTTTTYTITYDANGGAFDEGTTSFTAATTGSFTVTTIEPTYSGYVFVGWNTAADATGISYAAGGDYTVSSDLKLYAQWLEDEDYIGIAVAAAMAQFQSDYRDTINTEWKDSSIQLENVAFNSAENPKGTRTQTVAADVTLSEATVDALVNYAVNVAYGLLTTDADHDSVSLAEVSSTVSSVVDSIENEYNINISYDINAMAKSIYSNISAVGGKLWSNFRDDSGLAYTGDVTVSCGTAEANITVTDSSAALDTSSTTRAAVVKKFAAQIAVDMYGSIQDSTAYASYTSDVAMTATVTFVFSDGNAYGEATKNYPHTYPIELTLNLTDESGTFAYKYTNGTSYLKFAITEEMQTEYADLIDAAVKEALASDSISATMEYMLYAAVDSFKDNATFADLKGALTGLGISESEATAMINSAMDEWKDDNPSEDIVWGRYVNGDFSTDCDNSAIYDLVDEVAEVAAETAYEALTSALSGYTTAVVNGLLNATTPDNMTNLASWSVSIDLDTTNPTQYYVLSYIADYLNAQGGTSNSYASAARDAMEADVDDTVSAAMEEELDSNKTYQPYGELIDNLIDLRNLFSDTSITLAVLSDVAENDVFGTYVNELFDSNTTLNNIYSRLNSFLSKIPSGASLSVGSCNISASNLSKLSSATKTSEFITALCDILTDTGLDQLSLGDFEGEGQEIDVVYNSYDVAFNLVLDIE
ncbi:MAG: S-layer homology domain-containing protein [Oscillospiraceae bacterium]|nr:S-layer homology domain-containing protein [Oscillospiraceae bacterium]